MAEGIKKISENVVIEKRAFLITDPLVPDNDAISIGALWTDSNKKGIKIKTGKNTLSFLDAAQVLLEGSIPTKLLADKSVTNIKVDDRAINERTLENLSVTEPKLANLSVTEPKLDNQSVTSSKVRDSNILNRHVKNNELEGIKFKDKTITGLKIADRTLEGINFNDNTIDGRILKNKCLLERHFSEECVPHIAFKHQSVWGDVIKRAGVENIHLAINAVNTEQLMNGCVTEPKIADRNIKNKHLDNECVDSNNIAPRAIKKKHYSDLSIPTSAYENNSVTREKLAKDVVDLIGDPVMYDSDNNVNLRKDLNVNGNIEAKGTINATRIYNSTFMDIAEAYEPDKDVVFIPGDIVQVNDKGLLVKGDPNSHFPIVGTVSNEYANCLGATEEELEKGTKIPVGLIGKVHVNVVGPVKNGDKIALAKDGLGASCSSNNLIKDNIIGKALESNDSVETKKVLCLIYPR